MKKKRHRSNYREGAEGANGDKGHTTQILWGPTEHFTRTVNRKMVLGQGADAHSCQKPVLETVKFAHGLQLTYEEACSLICVETNSSEGLGT